MPFKALVVGSGFEAIFAAYYLKKNASKIDVDLVSPDAALGGIMRSIPHHGFYLDLGCQVFDNFDTNISDIFTELADEKYEAIDITYGSRFAGTLSEEMSSPDLTGLEQESLDQIIDEIYALKNNAPHHNTLQEYYEHRWGPKAAYFLGRVNRKFMCAQAVDLDTSSRIYTSTKRIRVFADNQKGLEAKQSCTLLNAKIAVPRSTIQCYTEAQHKRNKYNLHPMHSSFAGFCTSAGKILSDRGVHIELETTVKSLMNNGTHWHVIVNKSQKNRCYDLVIWTGSIENLCKLIYGDSKTEQYLDPIGMNLDYFFCKAQNIKDLGYFHNYDEDMRFFRWSSMGLYSQQMNTQGESFCCVETTGEALNDLQVSQHWRDLKTLGLVSGEPTRTPYHLYIPNVIKRRRPGYTHAAIDSEKQLAQYKDNLIFMNHNTFGRVPNAHHLCTHIEMILNP